MTPNGRDELTVNLGQARVISETEKAILVELDGDADDRFWVPQSQVSDDSEVSSKGDEGELVVTQWWALKNGRAP